MESGVNMFGILGGWKRPEQRMEPDAPGFKTRKALIADVFSPEQIIPNVLNQRGTVSAGCRRSHRLISAVTCPARQQQHHGDRDAWSPTHDGIVCTTCSQDILLYIYIAM